MTSNPETLPLPQALEQKKRQLRTITGVPPSHEMPDLLRAPWGPRQVLLGVGERYIPVGPGHPLEGEH